MTSVTHMAAGFALTQVVPNPALSLPLAFSSHFILDALPHNDYIYLYFERNWQRMHESVLSNLLNGLALGLCIYLAWQASSPVIAFLGGLLGLMPDILSGFMKRYNRRGNLFFRFHNALHSTLDLGEFLHNLTSYSSKKVNYPENSKEFKVNFDAISHRFSTKLGWLISLSFELGLLILFLWLSLIWV